MSSSVPRLLVALCCALLSACSVVELEPAPPYLAVRGRDLAKGAWGFASYLGNHSYLVWRRAYDARPRETERNLWGIWHEPGDEWDHDHETYTLLTGEDALEAISRLDRAIEEHPNLDRYVRGYVAWPGPNSNTFIADICRRAGIPVDLPPTAVAKDWPGLIPFVFDAGRSTTRTGLQLDFLSFFGLQIGLREGIEFHFVGSAIGIDLWPPALKFPVVGRIGFPEGLGGVERVGDLWEWIDHHEDDADPLVRAQVAAAIGSDSSIVSWGGPDATRRVDLLLKLLADTDERVRIAAVASLARSGLFFSWQEWEWYEGDGPLSAPEVFERALAATEALASSETVGLRLGALDLVALLGDMGHGADRLRALLIAGSADADPSVREQAAKVAKELAWELSDQEE